LSEMSAEVASSKKKLGAKGQLRRAKILAVAKDILLKEGFDNLILRQIATIAEIKLGHLQYYFPTRDDLLEAIVCETWDSNELVMNKAETAEDLPTIISDLLEGWGGEQGRIYLVLTLRSLHDQRFMALKQKIYLTFYEQMIQVLKKTHPKRSKNELLRKAKVITSLLDGAMFQIHMGSAEEQRKQGKRFHADLRKVAIDLALS
jgi:AcrR family transcriptional regulator